MENRPFPSPSPPLTREESPDSSKRLIEVGARVLCDAVGVRVALCPPKGAAAIVAGAHALSTSFAKMVDLSASPGCCLAAPYRLRTNAIHYGEIVVFGAYSSSLEGCLAVRRCVD